MRCVLGQYPARFERRKKEICIKHANPGTRHEIPYRTTQLAMLALWLLAAMSLASHAASIPMSYHALTDEATGSVLIFPAARSVAPMSDLRGIPDDVPVPSAVKKDEKGFLSSWFNKPTESRPSSWPAHPAPAPHRDPYHHDHYDPYYYPGPYPLPGYPTRYPDRYHDHKFPDKNSKWQGLVDKFHGLYYDSKDKLASLHYDKYDKYSHYPHPRPQPYPHDYYGPYHSDYHGLGWGYGGYQRYPHSDRPYEWGYEGGPYDG